MPHSQRRSFISKLSVHGYCLLGALAVASCANSDIPELPGHVPPTALRSWAADAALPRDASTDAELVDAERRDTEAVDGSHASHEHWPVEPLPARESDGDGGWIEYSDRYRARMGTSGRGVLFCRRSSIRIDNPIDQLRYSGASVVRARLLATPTERVADEPGGIFGTGKSTTYREYTFQILEVTRHPSGVFRTGETLRMFRERVIVSYGLAREEWVTERRARPTQLPESEEVEGSEWLIVASRSDHGVRLHRSYGMQRGRLIESVPTVSLGANLEDIERIATEGRGSR